LSPVCRALWWRSLATLSRCHPTMWTNRTKSFGFALAITAIAASAALPSQASAQEAEGGFANSWFWGVRAGAMSVQTNVQDEFAPMGGLEWLITRERVGLHIAVGQAFFNDIAVVVPDALGMPSEVGRPSPVRRYRTRAQPGASGNADWRSGC